ncbi:nucleolar complex-associated protein 2 [Impatiens glandulifera]|uniref:nucleolar complex-associated protein 2 n=1 Tax=Impatiens glandulifera TaxID=253017 RepID=UPI001FB1584D|nr:nucleolar complex-associated protein 2 [Impatiens glandulifera]XP_047327534.1 nucleolar complex-associated protein 2 [Impatiens glandulifera]
MGKLGKKARKFSKKNLQSVLKKQRKTKVFFKKKSHSKEQHIVDKPLQDTLPSNGRDSVGEAFEDISLDAIFPENYEDLDADASESDGFLSEESDDEQISKNEGVISFDVVQSTLNKNAYEELAMQKKKLTKLKEKDAEFTKFLASYNKGLEELEDDGMDSEEDEANNKRAGLLIEDNSISTQGKVLTTSLIDSLSQRIRKEHDESALVSLLNGYGAACHYGTESFGSGNTISYPRIQNSEAFSSILILMLQEADNIFRGLLKISSSNCKKETILELKNTSKWKKLRPLIKSYLRSTLLLLDQVTDSDMLTFVLSRLQSSVVFFSDFPGLLRRLIKLAVQLWTTGEEGLSSCSFSILKEVSVIFSSESYETCLVLSYKAYMAQSKTVEVVNVKHIESLRNSLVKLYSLDVYRSCPKAVVSIRQLSKILKQGLRTKKEALKQICSWEYVNCIDLWVKFISENISDYDLQLMSYTMVRLINGVAGLFPGAVYLPLRLKCIQWLNHLSRSGGVFIPVVSLVLDVLEYKTDKEGTTSGKAIDFTSVLKLPMYFLKSGKFKETCVQSAIELLVAHFAQWSYHISFPELATIPLIRLRELHEMSTSESSKRAVKRLIDHVEQNVQFVQKKRDEVAFSPKDYESVESFPQIEKSNQKKPFAQYYKSIMEKPSKFSCVNGKSK